MLLATLATLPFAVLGCRDTLDPWPEGRAPVEPQFISVTDTVIPLADAYIRQTLPNTNWGQDTALQVGGSGKNRVLIRFDTTAIRSAVGAGTLDSAWVEFTIKSFPQSGWGDNGRTVDLHRLLKTWTEDGATWNCAIDNLPLNTTKECPSTSWDMGNNANGTYVGAKTDRVTLVNNQTGVIRLNVTADVQGFLAGTLVHQGWLFRKTNEATGGEALVLSRETDSRPRLLLSIAGVDTTMPVPPSGPLQFPEDSTLAVSSPMGAELMWYRMYLGVAFADTVSGRTVRQLISKYGATIVGAGHANPHPELVMLFPDPGPTVADLEGLRTRLLAEPGVVAVYRWSYREPASVQARFPSDGSGSTRINWQTPYLTNATRSRVAVRAPLAWGCETGTYGGSLPRVGIIDWTFDNTHPDLRAPDGSARPVVRSSDSLFIPPAPLSPTDVTHGTGVAGILTASGDNGIGIAGIMWNADISLFAFAQGAKRVRTPSITISALVDSAISRNITVLVFAMKLGMPGESQTVERLDSAFTRFARSGGILVIATGNAGLRLLPDSIKRIYGGDPKAVGASDQAAVSVRDRFPNSVFFVAGTDASGALWASSNFWLGITDFAAPAESIQTLAYRGVMPSGDLYSESGTSFSAPFVGGVAAGLLAMDPSLTAAQVRDLLVRGSRQPKVDPTTGDTATSPEVLAGSSVHQLDAYSSLTLLSSERSGTPLCGFDVTFENGDVVLHRPSAGPEYLHFPGWTDRSISVAQGGRRIAVGQSIYNIYADPNPRGVTVISHTGATIEVLPNLHRRVFLERDTADIRYVASTDTTYQTGEPRLDITGPGHTAADLDQQVFAGLASGDLFYAGWIEVSPDARYIAAPMWDYTYVGCPGGGSGVLGHSFLRLIPLDGSPARLVRSSAIDFCDPSRVPVDEYAGNDQGVFSHDGSRAIFGVAFTDADPQYLGNDVIRSRLYNVVLATGGQQATVVEGRYVQGLRFDATGARLLAQDWDGGFNSPPPGGPCLGVTRQASSLGTVLDSMASLPEADCLLVQGGIVRSNLRGARAANTRQGRPGRGWPPLPN